MTLNTSFQPLLACKVSLEKSADSLMGTPALVTVSFSLSASEILSLSLILGNVINRRAVKVLPRQGQVKAVHHHQALII